MILKTKKAFKFVWQWDIQGIFGNKLFKRLPLKEKEFILTSPADYIMSYFSSLFKVFSYEDSLTIVKSIVPRMYLKGEVVFKKGD